MALVAAAKRAANGNGKSANGKTANGKGNLAKPAAGTGKKS